MDRNELRTHLKALSRESIPIQVSGGGSGLVGFAAFLQILLFFITLGIIVIIIWFLFIRGRPGSPCPNSKAQNNTPFWETGCNIFTGGLCCDGVCSSGVVQGINPFPVCPSNLK